MSTSARGPGVRFPPPLIFVGGLLLGWYLDTERPYALDGAGATTAQLIGGWLLAAAGAGMMAWGIATLRRARTTIMPNRPASQMVAAGPYRFTRNPIYVGMLLIYLGVAGLLNNAWQVILLPVVLAIVTIGVIGREERYLRDAFGAAYDDYCRRARRWL